jgi:hypothetical protein
VTKVTKETKAIRAQLVLKARKEPLEIPVLREVKGRKAR